MTGNVRVEYLDDRIIVRMKAAYSRWPLLASVFFGVPWLLSASIGSVWFLGWSPIKSVLVRVLLWVVVLLLTVFLHVLAIYVIWATSYASRGVETLTATASRAAVRRRALGITIPFKIRLEGFPRARMLDPASVKPGGPRIELASGKAAVRFGGSLDDAEVYTLVREVNAFFESHGRVPAG